MGERRQRNGIYPVYKTLNLLEIQALEGGHLVSHKGIIILVDGTGQFEVLNLGRVHLQPLGDGVFKASRNSIVDYHIFPRIVSVGHIVRLPGSYTDSAEFDFVLSCTCFLADGEVEGRHLARKILSVDFSGEIARCSVYAYSEQGLAGGNGLRHHYGPEVAVVVKRDDAGEWGFAFRGDETCSQIDGGFAYGIGHEHFLGSSRILRSIGPALALGETHAHRRHYMPELKYHLTLGRSYSRGLGPKEVGGLIMGHQTVLCFP